MKISYNWLNHHFHEHEGREQVAGIVLPAPEKIAEKLTFQAYQVESVEKVGSDFVLDIDVLPNRAHDSLSHRGIAREIGRIFGKKVYSENITERKITSDKNPIISIEDKRCRRYAGIVLEGIKVEPSPKWLKECLETLGQRSINNIVDITNFVMLETGQPLHAFDMDKLSQDKNGNPEIIVRNSASEKIITLDNKEVILDKETLVIADRNQVLAIAGIKGGKAAEVTPSTKNILVESANFDFVAIRKTSRKINIRTESSYRFERDITPELAKESLELAVKLIVKYCGNKNTKASEVTDVYPRKRQPYKVGVSTNETNKLLGIKLKDKDIERLLKQLGFEFEMVDPIKKVLDIVPSFINIPYKYGASISYDAPKSFDCSSFTAYIYSQAGVGIPRMAVDQYVFGIPVSEKEMKAGDLVFANTGETKRKTDYETIEFLPKTKVSEGVDHVGFYLGDGRVMHVTEKKGGVIVEDLRKSEQFKKISGYRSVINSKDKRFVVTVPSERIDLMAARSFLVAGIKEDLIEEIGRMYGYENIKAVKPKPAKEKPKNDENFVKANKIRQALVNQGFSEVMTYSFQPRGEIEIANPLTQDKKFLRTSLSIGLVESYELNSKNSPLLGTVRTKIFEIGNIFRGGKEFLELFVVGGFDKSGRNISGDAFAVLNKEIDGNVRYRDEGIGAVSVDLLTDIKKLSPTDYKFSSANHDTKYKPISQYPFVLRDIAVFVPEKISSSDVSKIIKNNSGELLAKIDLFDEFKKDGKISYAFHLVFQSHEKTLSDEEVNEIMEKITSSLNSKSGWQVR